MLVYVTKSSFNEEWETMHLHTISSGRTLAAATGILATNQPLDASLLVRSWKLTSVSDRSLDGRRRETWGSNPQGILQFTPNGIVSTQITGGDRGPEQGSVPTDPIGPFNAYYGTYTIDAANASVEMHVQQSSWPQWNGVTLKRSIEHLSATTLRVVTAPNNDPKEGAFTVHLEWERIR